MSDNTETGGISVPSVLLILTCFYGYGHEQIAFGIAKPMEFYLDIRIDEIRLFKYKIFLGEHEN